MGVLKEGYELMWLKYETTNFSQMSLLGKGSYAWVYYANDGDMGVVKKLDMSCAEDSDADFQAQLSVAYGLQHEHFTGLTNHYIAEDSRCLFYEYATMGSLHDVLYGRKGLEGAEPGPVLTWDQRAKIAYGAAKGLEYLHEMVDPPVVHGDIRSSNVLLFDDFTSKIADFRLTKALTDNTLARSNMTRPVGSCGYDGPEYDTTDQVTEKSDVYSFGVVLLELLTGRKPVDDTLPEEQQNLVTWATPYLSEDKVEQIIDPKLNDDFPSEAVTKVAALANLCIQDEPDFRPNMSIMVKALEPLQNIPEAPIEEEPLQDIPDAPIEDEPLQNTPDAPEDEPLQNIPEDEPPQNISEAPIEDEIEDTLEIFRLAYLEGITNDFSQLSLVAKSSYAWVYACFDDNKLKRAAIKKLDLSISQDSDADFAAQLSVVSKLKHEYFTELLGYCLEEDNRILIYELASKGSLHDVLYGRKHVYGAQPGPTLTWAQRAKIAYGAAKGLEYLHEIVDPPIVHGDVRSSNVLLFHAEYDSKIGDFHLTSCPKDASTEIKTRKTDVYCFGVVLLELLTGRKPVDNTLPEEQQNLVTWATPYLNAENLDRIIDPKLKGIFPLDEVAKVAAMAELCIQNEPDLRPDMSTVAGLLETIVDVFIRDYPTEI